MPDYRRRLLVIYNPTAGRRKRARLEAYLDLLEDSGCAVEFRPTTKRGDAEAFAHDGTADRYDAVVAAGGPERVFRVHGATAPDPCHYPLPGRGPRGPRCTARRRASNARCNVVGSCRQFVLTLGVDP